MNSTEQRVKSCKQWATRQNKRPLLGFFIDSQYPLHRYPNCSKNLPSGRVQPEHIIPKDYLEDCDRLYELHRQVPGDFIWSAAPFPGVPWIEASLGCSVFADHQTGSTRAEPPESFLNDWKIPEFSVENPWVKKMMEFIPVVETHSRDRYGVGVTLIRGISDILSALFGGHDFLFKFYESPDKMKALIAQIVEYWKAFAGHYLEHMPLFHGGTGSLFYNYWVPGKSILIQEDAAALLSPELYEEFIFPGICEIADAFNHLVFHLHPSQFIPTDYLLKTSVDVIELHIDQGGPSAEDLKDVHKKVLQQKPLLVWGDLTSDDLVYVLQNQSYQGLAINVVVDSLDQANEKLQMVNEIIDRHI